MRTPHHPNSATEPLSPLRRWIPIAIFLCGILFVDLPPKTTWAAVIQGRVIAVVDGVIRIDRGTEAGISVGDKGKVYYTVLVGPQRQPHPIYVAGFTITGVEDGLSSAILQEESGEVRVGYLVEVAVVPPPPTPTVTPQAQQAKRAAVRKKKLAARRPPREGEVWRDPYLGMSFVWVPGGCFEMGCGEWGGDCSRAERPPHRVCVRGFWMARYEVTRRQWARLMGEKTPSAKGYPPQAPVDEVTWYEAVAFAEKLSAKTGYSFRLPTEAEWEYACRGRGKPQQYAGGATVDDGGWHEGNSDGASHPVGKKAPNDLGIYDMSGNVWEWCLDIYAKDAYSRAAPTLYDPLFIGTQYADIYEVEGIVRILQGVAGNRSARGGSWANPPDRLRCTARIKGDPAARRNWLGFRLVREEKMGR